MKSLFAILVCAFMIFSPDFVQADGFGTALGIMDSNIPPDALSGSRGNTWAADPEGSSNNPACAAAGEPFKASVTGNYMVTFFKKGPTVHAYDTSFYAAVPFGGVAQISLGNTRSGSAATRMDSDFQFNHQPYFEVAYGLKVKEGVLREGDKLFLGVGAGANWSKMGFASLGQNVFVSRSRGMTLRCGALYQPVEGLNIGASYAWSRSWNEDRDLGTAVSTRSASDVHQTRVGVSWNISSKTGTTLAVDVQYLNLGHVNRFQVFAGVEQQLIKDRLYAYGGWAHSGPTAGLGLYFKKGGLNVAYMHNPFADLNPHLGRADTIMATAYFRW